MWKRLGARRESGRMVSLEIKLERVPFYAVSKETSVQETFSLGSVAGPMVNLCCCRE
jgi:hypothetical protein